MYFLSKSLLVVLALATSAVAELGVGEKFPNPSSNGVTGSIPSTSGKVVLYDFWGSWCGPCRASFPAYETLYQKYKGSGFLVVAIGIDNQQAAADKFLSKLKHSFPVCFDFKQTLVSKVRPTGMPTAFLVDKKGTVISVHHGFHGKKSQSEMDAAISAALSK